ncbi:MAG: hypothetical protein LBP35_05500 [Candidatus Ancillula trichonymphae]|nr:hypothetical protein [Candidatus Ancillula trichonymphae]
MGVSAPGGGGSIEPVYYKLEEVYTPDGYLKNQNGLYYIVKYDSTNNKPVITPAGSRTTSRSHQKRYCGLPGWLSR